MQYFYIRFQLNTNSILHSDMIFNPSNSGNSTLAQFIINEMNNGYKYGELSIMNFQELPIKDWTYICKWMRSPDNGTAFVELHRLYTSEYLSQWLKTTGYFHGDWYVHNIGQ